MIQPQMSFWGLYPEQVDPLWIELGFGIEAVLFNGDELTSENVKRFEEVVASFSLKGIEPITIHFPMNNANYLDNPDVYDQLLAFIDIACRNSICGIILHSNYHINVENVAEISIDRVRERFLALYTEIDRSIRGKGIWVGVENMPIMGNLGDEVDPIFVYPQDFEAFHFENVKIVFDLCHWTNTVETVRTWQEQPRNAHLYPPIRRCEMQGFLPLASQIVHLHLGAFKGIAIPPLLAETTEGFVPGEGNLSSRVYRELLTPFLSGPHRGLALEVREQDYTNRRQLWRTLGWLRPSELFEKDS